MRVTGSNKDIDYDDLMEFVESAESAFGRIDDFVNSSVRDSYEEARSDSDYD